MTRSTTNKKTSFRLMLAAVACSLPFAAFAQGYLENPVAGGIESGIGLVSGWHCTAKEIRVFIDGVDIGTSGVGSIRNDTAPICGRSNTGFSVLYNYNKLTPGLHAISVYADGAHLETRQFDSIRSGGVPFLEGVYRSVAVADFPEIGLTTELRWSQAKQSFVVADSVADDRGGMVAALLRRLMNGTVYRSSLPPRGDATIFKFELDNGLLKLTRESEVTGTCVFTGEYIAMAEGISSSGTYTCNNATSGTYTASNLHLNSIGMYTGSVVLLPNGTFPGILEKHSGYDQRFGSMF